MKLANQAPPIHNCDTQTCIIIQTSDGRSDYVGSGFE